MPAPILSLLKYVFLAVLYLFFLRVLRAVWVELREPRLAEAPRPEGAGAGDGRPAPLDYPPVPSGSPTVATAFAGVGAGAGARGLANGPRLVVRSPDGRSDRFFELPGEVSVGRAPGCGIALTDDTFVSSVHARLFRRDDAVWVEDLGSTNGTFLNGERVSLPTILHAGDRLRIGQSDLGLEA